MEAKQVVEELTNDVIIEIMNELGSPLYGKRPLSDGTEYLIFRTICHGGSSEKLYWYENNKVFQCWTNCGTMSVFDLVSKVKHCDFLTSLKYVAHKVGLTDNSGFGIKREVTVDDLYAKFINACEKENGFRQRTKLKEIDKFYTDIVVDENGVEHEKNANLLEYFVPYSSLSDGENAWFLEGISREAMDRHYIRWYQYSSYVIIPHYNIDGKLVGIRRRSYAEEDAKNKYMPLYFQFHTGDILYDHPLGMNLYGLYENKEAIKRLKKVILVEGEKSVLKSYDYFGEDSVAVATCGFNVSKWQSNMLDKLGVLEVYIAFDKDVDLTTHTHVNKYGTEKDKQDLINYEERLEKIARSLYYPNRNVYIVEDLKHLLDLKDSPFDKGKEVCEQLLKSARKV